MLVHQNLYACIIRVNAYDSKRHKNNNVNRFDNKASTAIFLKRSVTKAIAKKMLKNVNSGNCDNSIATGHISMQT